MPSPKHCSDVLAAVEREGLSPLPADALSHLSDCPDCQGFIADLNSIVSTAHELPAEVEPPARIWIALRAQLTAEGMIHEIAIPIEPVPSTSRWHGWWHGLSMLLHGRVLATAAVGLLIMVAGVVELRSPNATTPAPVPATGPSAAAEQPAQPDALAASGAALNQQERDLRAVQPAGTLASSPVDDSLQKDLQTLDAFIVECERHLKANPRDELAREYLAGAYQQKAELLAEMMDRGRSVN